MIPESTIADIRERADIVALVGEYVRLKRSGQSFKGLCPFHNEKTPSFYVHGQRRFFHCFGCGVSGDAIEFVMNLEGLGFRDAVQRLAERTGVEIPDEDPKESAEHRRRKKRRERLAEVMDAATGFYVRMLDQDPNGRLAKEAIAAREVGAEAAERFRLGYAPYAWDALARHLASAGHAPEDAAELGLIVPRRSGNGFYDRFRHRLMFPIADIHGRVVAFSGRALPPPAGEAEGDEPPAKYINSPEGPLYKKGEVLYGLHEGRVAIRRRGWVILCEGNFDLVALHQAGFTNSVAPMGTAFTAEHAKLLRRFAERVVLLFDGDAAGLRAVRAVFPLLQQVGLGAQVVGLPKGSDPDTFLRSQGAEALERSIEAAPGVVSYLIEEAAAEAGVDPQARAEAIAGLGPVLMEVDNPVEVPIYVERIAQKFAIKDLDAVRRQLRRGVREGRKRGGSRSVERPREDPSKEPAPSFRPPPLQAEMISVILDYPELFNTDESRNLGELLTSPDLRAIFRATSRMVEHRGVVDGPALVEELSGNPAVGWLEERLARHGEYDLGGAKQILRDGVRRLGVQVLEDEKDRLRRRIIIARREGDEATAVALSQELVELDRSAHKLKLGSTKR